MTQLSAFIRENIEPILAEWEEFARNLTGGESMDIGALREPAKDMLGTIADDLDQAQTAQQQSDKARGGADADVDPNAAGLFTAAQEHGAGRAEHGFSVEEMIAEFRALRASVTRLWAQQHEVIDAQGFRDLTRFNESVDQAMAESVAQYSRGVGESRERFLAILGHDLRNPIGAITTSTAFMLEHASDSDDLAQPYRSLIEAIARSARRMSQMVADLLEFARVSFGHMIPIERAAMDLTDVVRGVVAEVRESSPERRITLNITGDLRGEWDADRLFQAITNLLTNAVQHGSPAAPIRVTASGKANTVVIAVQNAGPTLGEQQIKQIARGMDEPARSSPGDRHHLGLGLYIVNKIVTAHGGRVGVQSSDEAGTTFTLSLPRVAERAPA
jgi:signal transduction histidine kinase